MHKRQQRSRLWLWAVPVLLGMVALLRGGFFARDQMVIILLGTVLFVTYLLREPKGDRGPLGWLDFSVLGLMVMYAVSIGWAVNYRAAIQEALKQLSYVGVYWVVSRSVRDDAQRGVLLKGLAGVTVFVSVASFVTAAGWIPYQDAILADRLGGLFQYPNTLAAFTLAGFVLTLSLRTSHDTFPRRAFWLLGAVSNLAAFLLTASRTAMIILPVAVVGLLIGTPKKLRWDMLLGVGAAGLVSGAVFVPMDSALHGVHLYLPLVLLGALAVTALLEVGVSTLNRSTKSRVIVVTSMIVAIGAVAGILLVRRNSLMERLATISTADVNFQLRYWTYVDALRAWRTEGPLLGMGGGGWKSVYLTYRRIDFVAKLVHSSLVETLTDVGLLGAVLFISVWFSGLVNGWRTRRAATDERSAVMMHGALVAALAILAHSMMDFDLSYMLIPMWLYALLGGFCRSPAGGDVPRWHGYVVRTLPWVAGAVAMVCLPLTAAAFAQERGDSYVAANDSDKATASYAMAATLDPLNGAIQAQYGVLLVSHSRATKSGEEARLGLQHLQRAMQVDPRNPDYIITYADAARGVIPEEERFTLLNRAAELDPYTVRAYGLALDQAFSLITKSLGEQNRSAALGYVQRVGQILTRYDYNRRTGLDPQRFGLSTDLRMDMYRAQYLAYTGDLNEAVKLLQTGTKDATPVVQKLAWLWLGAIHHYRGEADQAREAQQTLAKLDPNLAANAGLLEQYLRLMRNGQ